jgi:hypothetical protein
VAGNHIRRSVRNGVREGRSSVPRRTTLVVALPALAALLLALGSGAGPQDPPRAARLDAVVDGPAAPRRGLRAAFIGDQSMRSTSRRVLRLIRDEAADLVLHQGDLDYRDEPELWDAMISEELGPDFPYFVSIGNHDTGAWPGYEARLESRLQRVERAEGRTVCSGRLGVSAACNFRGLFFVLSGVGTLGGDHEAYLRSALSSSAALWKVCSWHKTMPWFQIGRKDWPWDRSGWASYEACREAGAIIVTAHDHAYAASCLMASFERRQIASCAEPFHIGEGRTAAFVSGLGGAEIAPVIERWSEAPWWAATYSEDHGALFCTFNARGDPREAECYFKNVDGAVVHEVRLVKSHLGLG